MKDTSEVTALVVDHGIFVPVARRLAREFKRVYYYSPHEKAFPTVKDAIGDGFEDIHRVGSIWAKKDECDLYVFPDIGFSDDQDELISQGKVVWGARNADLIEISRGKFIDTLLDIGLPIPNFHKIVGMSSLKEHLRDKRDKWVKISKYRGDWETLHFRSWEQDEGELDFRSVKLGPWKELISFYVFDDIETNIEDGCDTYCIDGEFPSLVIHGMESKDKAYLGAFQKMADLPKEVSGVLDAFGPVLKPYHYRSLFSEEVRITKEGESYFIDPTLRAGSPPSQVMCEMIGNLGEIVWRGAHGELVEPDPSSQFGAQAIVCSKGDHCNWRVMPVSPEIDQWLKCGFCSKIGDQLCFPPDPESTGGDIGWLVGVGNTIKESIESLKDHSEMLPDGCTCNVSHLMDILKEIEEAEKSGMEFTDQPVPEPSEVVD